MTVLPPRAPSAPLAMTVRPLPELNNPVAARLISHEMGRLRNGAVLLAPGIAALLLAMPAGWQIAVSPPVAVLGFVPLRWILFSAANALLIPAADLSASKPPKGFVDPARYWNTA